MALKDVAVFIAIFMLFFNAVPSLMVGSGLNEDLGFTPSIAGSDTANNATSEMENIRPSGGFAGTLFQLYNSVTGPIEAVMGLLFGAELMLMSAGVPTWLVTFIITPKAILGGAAIIYVLSGRAI